LEWKEGSQSRAADAVKQRRASREAALATLCDRKAAHPQKKPSSVSSGGRPRYPTETASPLVSWVARVMGTTYSAESAFSMYGVDTGAISVIQWSDGGRQTDQHLLLVHFKGISAADNHKGRKLNCSPGCQLLLLVSLAQNQFDAEVIPGIQSILAEVKPHITLHGRWSDLRRHATFREQWSLGPPF
jgi:hypothetical protein